MEVRVFGRFGVVKGFLIGADFSDMGGDGGGGSIRYRRGRSGFSRWCVKGVLGRGG